jgi:BarA-like signal transduction histidine kinase
MESSQNILKRLLLVERNPQAARLLQILHFGSGAEWQIMPLLVRHLDSTIFEA